MQRRSWRGCRTRAAHRRRRRSRGMGRGRSLYACQARHRYRIQSIWASAVVTLVGMLQILKIIRTIKVMKMRVRRGSTSTAQTAHAPGSASALHASVVCTPWPQGEVHRVALPLTPMPSLMQQLVRIFGRFVRRRVSVIPFSTSLSSGHSLDYFFWVVKHELREIQTRNAKLLLAVAGVW